MRQDRWAFIITPESRSFCRNALKNVVNEAVLDTYYRAEYATVEIN